MYRFPDAGPPPNYTPPPPPMSDEEEEDPVRGPATSTPQGNHHPPPPTPYQTRPQPTNTVQNRVHCIYHNMVSIHLHCRRQCSEMYLQYVRTAIGFKRRRVCVYKYCGVCEAPKSVGVRCPCLRFLMCVSLVYLCLGVGWQGCPVYLFGECVNSFYYQSLPASHGALRPPNRPARPPTAHTPSPDSHSLSSRKTPPRTHPQVPTPQSGSRAKPGRG